MSPFLCARKPQVSAGSSQWSSRLFCWLFVCTSACWSYWERGRFSTDRNVGGRMENRPFAKLWLTTAAHDGVALSGQRAGSMNGARGGEGRGEEGGGYVFTPPSPTRVVQSLLWLTFPYIYKTHTERNVTSSTWILSSALMRTLLCWKGRTEGEKSRQRAPVECSSSYSLLPIHLLITTTISSSSMLKW